MRLCMDSGVRWSRVRRDSLSVSSRKLSYYVKRAAPPPRLYSPSSVKNEATKAALARSRIIIAGDKKGGCSAGSLARAADLRLGRTRLMKMSPGIIYCALLCQNSFRTVAWRKSLFMSGRVLLRSWLNSCVANFVFLGFGWRKSACARIDLWAVERVFADKFPCWHFSTQQSSFCEPLVKVLVGWSNSTVKFYMCLQIIISM